MMEEFLKDICCDLDVYTAKLKSETGSLQNDFTTFRKHPFLRFKEGFVVCIDYRFMLDKMDIGVFWGASRGDSTNKSEHYSI